MTVSLKLLFAITLIAILCVNGLNNRYKTSQLIAQSSLLAVEFDSLTAKTRCADERELVYQRAWSAFEQQKEKLAKFGLDERFLIRIPESPSFELCLGYHKMGIARIVPLPLRHSMYFAPAEQFSNPLPPGDSIVEISMSTPSEGTNTYSIKVNGAVVHEAERNAVIKLVEMMEKGRPARDVPQYSRSMASSNRTEFDSDGVVLVTANWWPTEIKPESFSLVVRPVEKEQ